MRLSGAVMPDCMGHYSGCVVSNGSQPNNSIHDIMSCTACSSILRNSPNVFENVGAAVRQHVLKLVDNLHNYYRPSCVSKEHFSFFKILSHQDFIFEPLFIVISIHRTSGKHEYGFPVIDWANKPSCIRRLHVLGEVCLYLQKKIRQPASIIIYHCHRYRAKEA